MPNDRSHSDDVVLDFDALAVLHLDGHLTAEQHADFNRQLCADPNKAARLASVAELHASLIELGRTSFTQAQTKPASSTSTRSHRRGRRSALRLGSRHLPPWGLAAAALLAVGIVAGLLVPWPTRVQDVLTVDQGTVTLERKGFRSRVSGGVALLPGDHLVTSNTVQAHIDSSHGDHLVLGGGSQLFWSPDHAAVRLDSGSLTADITPRSADKPFVLATPRADLHVIGTRFTVQADDSLSLLAVDHGRVRLANRDDHRQVEVAAKQLVVTTGSGELTAATGSLTAANASTGLTGDYFEHQDFTAWRFRRIDATIDFNWGVNGPDVRPDMRVGSENFSVRWRGYLVPPSSGTYTFTFLMDDGVRLWLDGRLVLDEWHLSEKLEFSTIVTLEAGHAYALRLDYYQQPRDAVIRWYTALDGQPRQSMPSSWLRPFEWTPPRD